MNPEDFEQRGSRALEKLSQIPSEIVNRKSPIEIFKASLLDFDEKFLSWADTRSGRALAMITIVAIMALAAMPAIQAINIYQIGYEMGRRAVK